MSQKTKQTPKKTGKPKDYTKSSISNAEECEPSSTDIYGKDGVLSFPLLKRADNEKMLPRYSAILNRTEKQGVRLKDLQGEYASCGSPISMSYFVV